MFGSRAEADHYHRQCRRCSGLKAHCTSPTPQAPIGQAPHPRAALILLQLAHEIDKLISAEGLALKVDIDGLLLHRSDRRGTALCCRRASDARLSR